MSFNFTLIKTKDSRLKCEGMEMLDKFFDQKDEDTKGATKQDFCYLGILF